MEITNCKACNDYRYIESNGLCRDCYPVYNISVDSVTVIGKYKQDNKIEKFQEYVEDQHNINTSLSNASDDLEQELCLKAGNGNVHVVTSNGSFILRLNSFQTKGREYQWLTDLYKSYQQARKNTDASLSESPKIVNSVVTAETHSFKCRQFKAVADKYTDSEYATVPLPALHHKNCVIYSNGKITINGLESKQKAQQMATEIHQDITTDT